MDVYLSVHFPVSLPEGQSADAASGGMDAGEGLDVDAGEAVHGMVAVRAPLGITCADSAQL